MTKESCVVLLLVAVAGASAFGALGSSMSSSIDSTSDSVRAPVAVQAATWSTVGELLAFAREATDAELFGQWAQAAGETRRVFRWDTQQVADLFCDFICRRSYLAFVVIEDPAALDGALTAARSIPMDHPRALALGDVASAQAKAGFIEAAHRTFEEARAVAYSIDATKDRLHAHYAIASNQADAGISSLPSFGEALAIARTLRDSDAAYWENAIATALAEAGYMDEARTTFSEARRSASLVRRDTYSLQELGRSQVSSGFETEGRETFREALLAAKAAENLYDRAHQELSLAAVQAELGLLEDARATFRTVFETSRAVPGDVIRALDAGEGPRAHLWKSIAHQQIQHGLIDQAREIHGESSGLMREVIGELIEKAETEPPRVPPPGPTLDAPRAEAALTRAELAPRIREARRSGAWLDWLPSDAETLEQWGSALVLDWERFADAPPALASLISGAAMASAIPDEQSLVGLGRLAIRELRLFEPDSLLRHAAAIEGFGNSQLAMIEARRSARAMLMAEPRPSIRGLLMRDSLYEVLISRSLSSARGSLVSLPVEPGGPHSVDALERLFASAEGKPATLRIENLDAFARADSTSPMLEALAQLMDNHPRVMVIGESANPAGIHPMLRERGRFGPLYQSAP